MNLKQVFLGIRDIIFFHLHFAVLFNLLVQRKYLSLFLSLFLYICIYKFLFSVP